MIKNRCIGAPLTFCIAMLFAVFLVACGDSEDSTTSSPAGSTSTMGESPPNANDSDSADSQPEGSASFRVPGGDNSIQNFGKEADEEEREAADTVLAAYLDARAAGDWAGQCKLLAKTTKVPMEQFAEQSPQTKGKGCAAALRVLTGNAASANSPSTLTGPIASLRIEGQNGFVLYHGVGGVDYFVPMVKEDGGWKLGALAPSEFS